MRELLSVGYAVIDVIDGEELYGGSAASLAINSKKLGVSSGLLALFGDDIRSKEYFKYILELGVDLNLSHIYEGSTIPINMIDHNDRTAGWTNDGITQYMSSVQINAEGLRSYGVVHLASSHFALAHRIAEHMGDGILTYSPGPKLSLNHDYLDIDTLRRSNILFLNEEEWFVVKQILDVTKPGELIKYGPEIVSVTHGHEGSTVSYNDPSPVEEYIPAKKIDGAEPTGAGDAFALGFIIGFINNLPPRRCAVLATKLAYMALTQKGTIIDRQQGFDISKYISE